MIEYVKKLDEAVRKSLEGEDWGKTLQEAKKIFIDCNVDSGAFGFLEMAVVQCCYKNTLDQKENNRSLNKEIYFIKNIRTGLIKIGRSYRAKTRINQLKGMNPGEIELVAKVSDSGDMEPLLHKLFSESRVNGEWFEPTNEIKELIEKINKSGPMALKNIKKNSPCFFIELRLDLASPSEADLLPVPSLPRDSEKMRDFVV